MCIYSELKELITCSCDCICSCDCMEFPSTYDEVLEHLVNDTYTIIECIRRECQMCHMSFFTE